MPRARVLLGECERLNCSASLLLLAVLLVGCLPSLLGTLAVVLSSQEAGCIIDVVLTTEVEARCAYALMLRLSRYQDLSRHKNISTFNIYCTQVVLHTVPLDKLDDKHLDAQVVVWTACAALPFVTFSALACTSQLPCLRSQ